MRDFRLETSRYVSSKTLVYARVDLHDLPSNPALSPLLRPPLAPLSIPFCVFFSSCFTRFLPRLVFPTSLSFSSEVRDGAPSN